MKLYDPTPALVSDDSDVIEKLTTEEYDDYCGWPHSSTEDKIATVEAWATVSTVTVELHHDEACVLTVVVLDGDSNALSHSTGTTVDTVELDVPAQSGEANVNEWELEVEVRSSQASPSSPPLKKLPLKVKVGRGGPGT